MREKNRCLRVPGIGREIRNGDADFVRLVDGVRDFPALK
jgi:hypothetical protein